MANAISRIAQEKYDTLRENLDFTQFKEKLTFFKIPIEGLAKIRHIGGRAIRKELEKRRRYIGSNMSSTHDKTRKLARENHFHCQLLEEFVIEPYKP